MATQRRKRSGVKAKQEYGRKRWKKSLQGEQYRERTEKREKL